MISDTLLSQNVIKCLIANFGVVQTERFISLVIKEPFDYTEWQRDLFPEMPVEDIFSAATAWKQSAAQNES